MGRFVSMTEDMRREYLRKGGKSCPKCNSGELNLHCEEAEYDGNVLRIPVSCTQCEGEWLDVYSLSLQDIETEED